MDALELEVVTPSRTVLKTTAESVIVPTVDGLMGFMANHAPLVAGLTVGIVEYGPERQTKQRIAVSGGFVEVSDNKVTILADAAELADEIDVARAMAAKERAERRLRQRQADIDYTRAEIALQRALNRLKASSHRSA